MHSNWNVFQFRRFAFCILGEIIQFCCYVFKTQTTSCFASKLFPNTTDGPVCVRFLYSAQ
jgi:hypothetical protein